MMLKNRRFLWLAAVALVATSALACADKTGSRKLTKAPCSSAAKSGCSDVVCDVEIIAAPACGSANNLELLGRLIGLHGKPECVAVDFKVAEDCCCSDGCKCGASCKCSKTAKCHAACKCSSAKKASANIWGEAKKITKKGCCGDKVCGASKCCGAKKRAVAKAKCNGRAGKKVAAVRQRPFGKQANPGAPQRHFVRIFTPHHLPPSPQAYQNLLPPGVRHGHATRVAPTFPAQAAAPHHPGHMHPCPSGDAHTHQLHQRLVKLLAENAELKATAKIQTQLIAHQKEHQKQMLDAQAQIFRLQAQVELVSRREEIRDQLVEASAELAHAEILMEIAEEHPEAFVKLMRGGDSKQACGGKNRKVQALKAENAELQTKITNLEHQMQKMIEHTAKQPQQPKYNAR